MLNNPQRLAAVGPISPSHGYPLWYKDGNGVRLMLALDPNDPNTPVIGDIPNPGAPLSIPGNFPDESFFFAAEAEMTVGAGGTGARARLILALEAAFGGTGDVSDTQRVVFGRIRVRMDDLIPGATYVITHPYGETDPLEADDRGRVFWTEDLGVAPQDFTGALTAHVAPFLQWTSGAPAGYLGDGVTEHTITGSPFGTNIFRVRGPGVGVVPGGPVPADPDVIETNLFTVQGKIATVLGVEPTRAVYTRTAGAVVVDVFARSETGQTIEVAGVGVSRTAMPGNGTDYTARAAASAVPAEVIVTNRSDVPVTTMSIDVTDAVYITQADYSPTARTLTVSAQSSDDTGPTLTVEGFGPLTGGTAVFSGVDAVASSIVVTSSALGSASATPRLVDGALPALPVVASAGADATADVGSTVTLDGSGSAGEFTSIAWTQTAGTPVTLDDANTTTPSFTAPATPADLAFTITVDGPGGPSSDSVTVHVIVPPVIVDTLTVDQAEFRTSKQQYRFAGTATAPLPNSVIVSLNGSELGRSPVDATGAWDVRRTLLASETALRPGPGTTVTITTTRGANAASGVRIRN